MTGAATVVAPRLGLRTCFGRASGGGAGGKLGGARGVGGVELAGAATSTAAAGGPSLAPPASASVSAAQQWRPRSATPRVAGARTVRPRPPPERHEARRWGGRGSGRGWRRWSARRRAAPARLSAAWGGGPQPCGPPHRGKHGLSTRVLPHPARAQLLEDFLLQGGRVSEDGGGGGDPGQGRAPLA